jgi:NHL repeat
VTRSPRGRATGLATIAALAVGLAVAAPSHAFEGYGLAGVFGGAGTGAGQLSSPGDVAIDESSGDVYVVDSANSRVEKFTAAGEFLSELNGAETPATSFSSPWGIAVDNAPGPDRGDVYVDDVGNDVVDVFASTGEYVTQITGTPGGPFTSLEGVAVGSGGQLWIYDEEHLDQFTAAGVYVSQFNTERGSQRGLAVDSHNNVYLLFGSSGGEYDEAGEQLSEWEVTPLVAGEEAHDTALAIDPATNEPFADAWFEHGASRLQRYAPFGEPFTEPVVTFGQASLSESAGVAVNGATGLVYATGDATNEVYIFKDALFPDVTTGAGSDLGQTTATVLGTIDPDGRPTTYRVEYGTTTAYGASTSSQGAGEGEDPVPVSIDLDGLEFGDTYHYRLVAENENGANFGDDETLTTLPGLPRIGQPGAATEVTSDGAMLTATLDTEKGETVSYFEYGTTPEYGLSTARANSSGSGESVVSISAGELAAGTTYHFRLVSTNLAGTVRGHDETFTTGPPVLPILATGGASAVSQTSATITGTVARGAGPSTYAFEIGTDPEALGAPTGLGSVGVGSGEAAATLEVQGLLPGTTYHYRILATNVGGTSAGAIESFTTATFPDTPLTPAGSLAMLAVPAIAFPGEPVPPPTPKSKAKSKRKKHKSRVRGRKAKPKRAKPKKVRPARPKR